MGDLAPDIPPYITDPTKFKKKVLGIVLGVLVGGLGVVLNEVVESIYQPIQSVLNVVHDTGLILDASVESVAESVFAAERSLTGIFIDLGTGAGLAAPLVTVVIALGSFAVVFVIVWVTVQVGKTVNPQ